MEMVNNAINTHIPLQLDSPIINVWLNHLKVRYGNQDLNIRTLHWVSPSMWAIYIIAEVVIPPEKVKIGEKCI